MAIPYFQFRKNVLYVEVKLSLLEEKYNKRMEKKRTKQFCLSFFWVKRNGLLFHVMQNSYATAKNIRRKKLRCRVEIYLNKESK